MKRCSVIAAVLASTFLIAGGAPAAEQGAQPAPFSRQKPPSPGIFCADPAVTLRVGAPTFSGGVFRVSVVAKICNDGPAVFNAPAGDELKLVINGIAERREGNAWKFLDEPGRLLQWIELQPYLTKLTVNECKTLPWTYTWKAADGPSTAKLDALASGPKDGKFRVGLFAFASNAKNQTEPLNPTYPSSLNCREENDHTERVYLYLK